MPKPEYYVSSLISRCEEILAGDRGGSTQEEIDNLMVEMEGFRFPLECTRSSDIIKDRTLNGVRRVRGWLAANFAALTAQSGSTTVKAEASASATADVAVSMTQAIRALDDCRIGREETDALKAAIADLSAAGKDKPETTCEKASRLLDLAKKTADTAKAVAPFVAAALSMLNG